MTSLSKCILKGVLVGSTRFVSSSCFGFGFALVGRVAGIYKMDVNKASPSKFAKLRTHFKRLREKSYQ
jgi:hypothetical protein